LQQEPQADDGRTRRVPRRAGAGPGRQRSGENKERRLRRKL
jgi:hypothetical protein